MFPTLFTFPCLPAPPTSTCPPALLPTLPCLPACCRYIMSIGANISTTYWYTSGSRPYQNEPFVAWLTALTALPDYELPNTVSVSYGDNEWQM